MTIIQEDALQECLMWAFALHHPLHTQHDVNSEIHCLFTGDQMFSLCLLHSIFIMDSLYAHSLDTLFSMNFLFITDSPCITDFLFIMDSLFSIVLYCIYASI